MTQMDADEKSEDLKADPQISQMGADEIAADAPIAAEGTADEVEKLSVKVAVDEKPVDAKPIAEKAIDELPVEESPIEEVVVDSPASDSRPPTPDSRKGERLVVVKHHALVRLSHWLNLPILFALTVSGLSIYWASPVFLHKPDPVTHSRDYLADIGIAIARHVPGAKVDGFWFYDHFGLGVFNLAGALRWHWLFVYLFLFTGFLYILGLLLGGGYRALLPHRGMVAESFAMIRYYAGVAPMRILRRKWEHPHITTKYNALQRGAYASMPIAGALALASGWAMHKPVQFWWLERLFGSYDGARIVHFAVMIYFILFLIPHIVLVLIDGWDTMRSMITGWSARTGGPHE
jgi:thiosulfate reductase cytochrome b subunit